MRRVYLITESCWTRDAKFEYGVFLTKESALAKAKELADVKAKNWERNSKKKAEVVQKGNEFWTYHDGSSNVYMVVESILYE